MARRSALQGRFGIVVSHFHPLVTRRLLEGCLDTLTSHGVPRQKIDVVWVPGSFEIPYACQAILRRRRYRALIALGAVIRGETPHFKYVASAASSGIMHLALASKVPIAFGIVTTLSARQALARAGRRLNRGREAALSALQMAGLFEELRRR